MGPPTEEVGHLLDAMGRGEEGAFDRLLPLIYGELRQVAHLQLRRRRPGQTLDTTALVHEVYLRLVDQKRPRWQDRGHFLAVAATAMRHILVDRARRNSAHKRGGEGRQISLSEADLGRETPVDQVLAIDQVLSSLAEVDQRLARLAELRIFGGLTFEEVAPVLGLSLRTVKRDWLKARAFLQRALADWS